MKSNKSFLVALFIALIFEAFSAKAQQVQVYPSLPFPVTYQFEPLNFNLLLTKQVWKNMPADNGEISSDTTLKINNQGLLNFLAVAFNTNWPRGAKLALDIQSLNIFVVDKSGTNPVFNASTGINDVASTNVAYFTFNASSPVSSNQQAPYGRVIYETDHKIINFHLHSETNGFTGTDLYISGLDTSNYKLTALYAAKQTEEATVYGMGLFQTAALTTLSGTITGSGSWHYPNPPSTWPLP